MHTKRLVLSAFVGLILIGAVIVADDFVFRTWLGTDYVRWYLKNGALINLVFAFVSLAWGDLNRVKDLVGAHPVRYISAAFYLIGLPITVFGKIIAAPERPAQPRPETRSDLASWSKAWRTAQRLMDTFDSLISSLIALGLVVAILAWLLVVAPLQYFVNLICAAPARLMRRGRRKIIAAFDEGGYFHIAESAGDEPVPAGWFEAGFYSKPVSMTSAFAAVFIWMLAQVIK